MIKDSLYSLGDHFSLGSRPYSVRPQQYPDCSLDRKIWPLRLPISFNSGIEPGSGKIYFLLVVDVIEKRRIPRSSQFHDAPFYCINVLT